MYFSLRMMDDEPATQYLEKASSLLMAVAATEELQKRCERRHVSLPVGSSIRVQDALKLLMS